MLHPYPGPRFSPSTLGFSLIQKLFDIHQISVVPPSPELAPSTQQSARWPGPSWGSCPERKRAAKQPRHVRSTNQGGAASALVACFPQLPQQTGPFPPPRTLGSLTRSQTPDAKGRNHSQLTHFWRPVCTRLQAERSHASSNIYNIPAL